MHAEHDRDRRVGSDDERQEVEDVRGVGPGDHLRDEREDPVGGECHDHVHQLHDDRLRGFHELADGLAALRIVAGHAERRDAEEDAEDHHRDDRRGPGAGEVLEDVGGYEAHQHVRHAERLDAGVALGQDVGALQLPGPLGEPFRAEAEQVGDEDAHEGGDHGCGDQDADHAAADPPERGHLPHAHHRCDHHDQHQRHDDHLQQVHVARADHVGPLQRRGDRIGIAAVDDLQAEAVDQSGEEPGQDLPRQREPRTAQPEQGGHEAGEHDQIENGRDGHGMPLIRDCARNTIPERSARLMRCS